MDSCGVTPSRCTCFPSVLNDNPRVAGGVANLGGLQVSQIVALKHDLQKD